MVTRIGNTAESQVSPKGAGLDEGQAASLLSAVGGHGLSLVESGPATDPARAGLLTFEEEQAYYRASRTARRMGEARLAQQQIQGVLDEADAGAVGLVESAAPPLAHQRRARINSNGFGHALHAEDERGRSQEGA